MAGSKPDEYWNNETYYQTQYGQWNGFVDRISLLRQIIDIRAAAIVNSWKIKGPHEKQATEMFDDFEGRGRETFKLIIANMYKIAYICGDSYAEKIYDDKDQLIDLKILPSDHIRQVINKGEIIRYDEINNTMGTPGTWKPYKIFHLPYMKRGAMSHGIGMIESMNNLLLSYEQMLKLGQEIYEKMSRPREIIRARTDNQDKLNTIRNAIKEAGDTWSGIAVLPGNLIEDVIDIQLTVSLKPQEWLDTISKEIFKSTATPELILGTGYSTSEEDAKTRIGGFMQSVRFDQEWLEENIYKQILSERWPTNPPEIEFSFATESQDEGFRRNLESLPILEALQTISPENKNELIKERLIEMGLVQ